MMDFLLDPNVAYVLLMAGFVMAVLALISPGTGLLELVSLFILFLAGYALLRLPVTVWALALIILSAVSFVISLRWYRHWALLAFSAVSLVVGTIFLYPFVEGVPAIDPVLVVVVSMAVLVILYIVGRRSMEAFFQQPAFDLDTLIGQTAQVREDFEEEGAVYVMGEEWTARTKHPLRGGHLVKVIGREGLVLLVEEDQPAVTLSGPVD
ncbi:MAG: NfeD family protein [Anaerolineaceae bacterium]